MYWKDCEIVDKDLAKRMQASQASAPKTNKSAKQALADRRPCEGQVAGGDHAAAGFISRKRQPAALHFSKEVQAVQHDTEEPRIVLPVTSRSASGAHAVGVLAIRATNYDVMRTNAYAASIEG